MTFYLQHTPAGRVFLSPASSPANTVIQTIEADGWLLARNKVQELEFNHIDGYGWYMPGYR
jgi:hypothetical protein